MPDAILIYLLAINLVAFLAMGWDKSRAKRDQPRIRERTLLLYGLIGGMWGMLYGMRTFHHKTRKASFKLKAALVVLVNVAVYAWLVYRWLDR